MADPERCGPGAADPARNIGRFTLSGDPDWAAHGGAPYTDGSG